MYISYVTKKLLPYLNITYGKTSHQRNKRARYAGKGQKRNDWGKSPIFIFLKQKILEKQNLSIPVKSQ